MDWITPNAVMKARKLKDKRSALKERFTSPYKSQTSRINVQDVSSKSSNPFRTLKAENQNKKLAFMQKIPNSSVFQNDFCRDTGSSLDSVNSTNLEKLMNSSIEEVDANNKEKITTQLPFDWSLKLRLRIHCETPLPWKCTFRSSEEASGTTGFTRCIDMTDNQRTLDTSSNAQFYQCCLVWQTPNLPATNLFPRTKVVKGGSNLGLCNSHDKNSSPIATALHSEWSDSLRSLFQLLRVRQCPFFYVCASTFTCLFRAAGVAGFSHTHAFITPTTKGFRKSMENEDVEFKLPLRKDINKIFISKNNQENEMNGSDLNNDSEKNSNTIDNDSRSNNNNKNDSINNCDNTSDSEDENDILNTLAQESQEFQSLPHRQKIIENGFKSVDNKPDSLVYVEDSNLHGLINFLLNCNSCVTNVGPHAGIPPTLLAPVGFLGASLKTLKINGSTVRTAEGATKHVLDINGPILPNTVQAVSSLVSKTVDKFSLSFNTLSDTVPFCTVSNLLSSDENQTAFASEGLIDCGLSENIRESMCSNSRQISDIWHKEIKFENGNFLVNLNFIN